MTHRLPHRLNAVSLAALALAVLAQTACLEVIDTAQTPTDELDALIFARTTDDQTLVIEGGFEMPVSAAVVIYRLDVDPAEQFTVSLGGEAPVDLDDAGDFGLAGGSGVIHESRTFTYDSVGELDAITAQPVVVGLKRPNHEDAPESVLTFPEPFAMRFSNAPDTDPSDPDATPTYSRADDDIVFAFDSAPTDEAVLITASATDCGLVGDHRRFWWTGEEGETVTIAAGSITQSEFFVNEDEELPTTCTVEMTARRWREGTFDPAFDKSASSDIVAEHVRTLRFVSVP